MRKNTYAKRKAGQCVVASFLLFTAFTWAWAQNQRPLLGTRRTGVEVTRDTTLDIALPSGFVLSGKVLVDDPFSVIGRSAVLARSDDRVFAGGVTVSPIGLAATYRLVLPAGTYRLYFLRSVLEDDRTVLLAASDLSRTVAITSDRTLDITPPELPEPLSLSGRITSPGRFPANGLLSFRSADRTVFAMVPFDPTYRAWLLPRSYTVMAHLDMGDAWASVRLGEINVSASGTQDFVLPEAVELSGRVTRATGQPAVPSTVSAVATADLANLPTEEEGLCEGAELLKVFFDLPQITSAMTLIPEESATGAYRMLLVPGAYLLSAGVNLNPKDPTGPTFIPFLERSITADATQDFTMPPLPPFVVLSGRITNERGQPVARARISASTDALSGTPNAAFTAQAETDAQGRYRLRLLSGTAYRIIACPPLSSLAPLPGRYTRRRSPF